MKLKNAVLLSIFLILYCSLGVAVMNNGLAYAANESICSLEKPSGMSEEEWNERLELAGCEIEDPAGDVLVTLRNVLTAVYAVVAILAVGAIIYGGLKFALSQGDSNKVSAAKNTVLYALIGLIVVLMAFVITNFVLGVFA